MDDRITLTLKEYLDEGYTLPSNIQDFIELDIAGLTYNIEDLFTKRCRYKEIGSETEELFKHNLEVLIDEALAKYNPRLKLLQDNFSTLMDRKVAELSSGEATETNTGTESTENSGTENTTNSGTDNSTRTIAETTENSATENGSKTLSETDERDISESGSVTTTETDADVITESGRVDGSKTEGKEVKNYLNPANVDATKISDKNDTDTDITYGEMYSKNVNDTLTKNGSETSSKTVSDDVTKSGTETTEKTSNGESEKNVTDTNERTTSATGEKTTSGTTDKTLSGEKTRSFQESRERVFGYFKSNPDILKAANECFGCVTDILYYLDRAFIAEY